MDQYCVMGNPVEHSRSPWIHERFAELTGQALRYGKRLVPPRDLERAVRAFQAEGGRGCNITVPLKFEAAALANRASERARLARAVNTLRFEADGGISADNTDGLGLVSDITHHAGVALAGRDLLLVGAGGAAAGVLGPLLEAGPRRLVIANRGLARADELAARHAALATERAAQLLTSTLQDPPGDFDVVINATASSLSGGGVPVPARVLRPGALAVDMMYGPAAQGFMDWATAHGARARDGLGMLVAQAAEAFAFWRGVRPPGEIVLAELRQVVARA